MIFFSRIGAYSVSGLITAYKMEEIMEKLEKEISKILTEGQAAQRKRDAWRWLTHIIFGVFCLTVWEVSSSVSLVRAEQVADSRFGQCAVFSGKAGDESD